jgi:hypothetical protein
VNDRELLEHIGVEIETNEKRGWWYATAFGRVVTVHDNRAILTVGMATTEEESISDAYKQLKAMVFKMVCLRVKTLTTPWFDV